MDMALHIVDPEVDSLLNTYLTGTGLTKTEAIRRLLREAVQRNRKKEKKAGLDAVLSEIWDRATRESRLPVLKEEVDALYKGTAE